MAITWPSPVMAFIVTLESCILTNLGIATLTCDSYIYMT